MGTSSLPSGVIGVGLRRGVSRSSFTSFSTLSMVWSNSALWITPRSSLTSLPNTTNVPQYVTHLYLTKTQFEQSVRVHSMGSRDIFIGGGGRGAFPLESWQPKMVQNLVCHSARNSPKNELAQISFWTGPVPFWTGPTEFEPALQKRHFFFTLSFMICSSCEWMFRMFMVTMATCGYHEHALRSPIGDPVPQSHWSDALPPHLHQRGVLTVTDLPTGQRTILLCYLSMAEWSVTCRRWVLVIWTPWSRSPAPNTLTDPCPDPPISTHSPQPPPGETDMWHYVMRWWAPGETRLCYPGSCLGEWVGMGISSTVHIFICDAISQC